MKNVYYLMLAVLLSPLAAFSQNETIDTIRTPVLYLKDGTKLEYNEFERKDPAFGGLTFYRNGEKIDFNDIKFYQSTGNLYAAYDRGLAPLIEKGALDMYLLETVGFVDGANGRMRRVTYRKYLFNKGFGDVKAVNYKNLAAEFSQFPNNNHPDAEDVILNLIKKGNNKRKTGTKLLLYGLAGFLGGAALVESRKNKELVISGAAICVAGFGTMVSSFLLGREDKFYVKAIKHYNKFY